MGPWAATPGAPGRGRGIMSTTLGVQPRAQRWLTTHASARTGRVTNDARQIRAFSASALAQFWRRIRLE